MLRTTLLSLCALVCVACQSGSAGPANSTAASSSGTASDITVAGDAQNHYPTVHVSRVECGNPGAADAYVSFLLPAAGPPSTIQSELLINLTGSRATALTALDTLFVAPSSAAIGRSGSVGPLKLQSTGVQGPDGRPLSTGALSVSGTYRCP